MKFIHVVLLLMITAYGIFESVQAQDQSVCLVGWSLRTQLIQKTTNIIYKSDADYIDSGSVGRISNEYKALLQQQGWTLRSFPEGDRNCYNFNLKANSKYLIRGSFVYGNYDGQNKIPKFDLHIGPNKWTSVKLEGVGNGSIYEMIHVLPQDHLQVCLVKTGKTIPFISSLELRPLNNNSYVTQSGSLIAVSSLLHSFSTDFHDRTWIPHLDNQIVSISTNLLVNTSNSYDVPQTVAKTAAIPANTSQPLTLDWSLDEINAQSYIYMHFAEIQDLEDDEIREFNITYNGGQNWYSYFRPRKLKIITIYNPRAVSSPDGNFNFSFVMTGNSTLPPLINSFEVYKVLDLLQLETDQDEVSAMVNIKTTYELSQKASWQGDPCAPQIYRWEGLNCSYPDSEPPRIISLNLAENNLTGTITTEIFKLTQLIELDLSKNDLSGEIPASFDMKFFYLQKLKWKSNLNRTIPDSLQQSLGDALNPTVKSKSKKVPVIAIAASLAGVIALVVILAIFYIIRKKNREEMRVSKTINPSIITKDRRITYPVLKMTNNFERVLGKGGFGTVYHGNLDDAQVAVELLLRVHHRHLVGLVGYCDDGDYLALIYEYMANGDLRRICPDSYLHNGCRPPMVHRDVKTTNILLDERYGAKLADFGLSRSFPIDGECHVSTVVAGTPGYLDPEYYRTNWLARRVMCTARVVLLEIRPHINEWVGFMLTKGDIRSIVDPKLMGIMTQTVRGRSRPTMAHVVMELNECVALENARRQGSEEMYSRGSVDFSLSSASEFTPGAR
ncbi:hypothetical protein Bca52824_081415 [Brassica carinata]|uniref:Protein kinase domain-containing protein n=1 Tax=Brassica carinata TaxID=52824 RepID=A0A8X7TRK0_BRACI|nr:hypothetical protein Bca52824_081415 [Brassica carinata]